MEKNVNAILPGLCARVVVEVGIRLPKARRSPLSIA